MGICVFGGVFIIKGYDFDIEMPFAELSISKMAVFDIENFDVIKNEEF